MKEAPHNVPPFGLRQSLPLILRRTPFDKLRANGFLTLNNNRFCKKTVPPVPALRFALALLTVLTLASLPAISAPGTSPAAPEPHIVPATETGALRQLLSLKLADADNRMVSLAQWRGRILVINFWATWCGPCKEEMPAFSRLQEQFRGQGVQFVGIAVDSAENVRTFSKKYPVSYPLPLGDDRLLTLSRQLGNAYMSLPFTLLIDKQGQISTRKRGRFAEQDLARQIQEALQTRAVKK